MFLSPEGSGQDLRNGIRVDRADEQADQRALQRRAEGAIPLPPFAIRGIVLGTTIR